MVAETNIVQQIADNLHLRMIDAKNLARVYEQRGSLNRLESQNEVKMSDGDSNVCLT